MAVNDVGAELDSEPPISLRHPTLGLVYLVPLRFLVPPGVPTATRLRRIHVQQDATDFYPTCAPPSYKDMIYHVLEKNRLLNHLDARTGLMDLHAKAWAMHYDYYRNDIPQTPFPMSTSEMLERLGKNIGYPMGSIVGATAAADLLPAPARKFVRLLPAKLREKRIRQQENAAARKKQKKDK